MPTPTYTPLATVTLASATSSVTFSSIPATYRDLILIINGKATAGGSGARMTVNSDTGNNYNAVRMYGYSSSTGSDSASNVGYLDISALNTSEGYQAVIQIMDYSATDKHKTFLYRTQESGITAVLAQAGRWANTAAITSVRAYTGSDNWAIGSTFSLYGVIA
jgi:hypothetical protein